MPGHEEIPRAPPPWERWRAPAWLRNCLQGPSRGEDWRVPSDSTNLLVHFFSKDWPIALTGGTSQQVLCQAAERVSPPGSRDPLLFPNEISSYLTLSVIDLQVDAFFAALLIFSHSFVSSHLHPSSLVWVRIGITAQRLSQSRTMSYHLRKEPSYKQFFTLISLNFVNCFNIVTFISLC